MTVLSENQVKLRDGRALGYAECGDPAGVPVLHFHGTPSSRLEIAGTDVDRVATAAAVRLIAPDRPGIGLSDPQPKRTILDWPVDVVGLAEALGLTRFLAIGVSGGGPYALACAFRIPHRLRAVGIVSGLAPIRHRAATEGMNPEIRNLLLLARWFGWGLRRRVRKMEAALRAAPDQTVRALAERISEPDRGLLVDPERRLASLRSTLEAFRRGSDGVYTELRLAAGDWGFSLAGVPMVVNLWFGGKDRWAPPAGGHYLANALTRSEARYYPDEGHLTLLPNRWEGVLRGLKQTAARQDPSPAVLTN